MKTQFLPTGNYKTLLSLVLFLFTMNGFSQQTSGDERLTSLQTVVENIKAKNESIKNEEHVNVMVNDMLIEDLLDFKIDPAKIAMVEVVVLAPKAGNERVKPSIIINTKGRQ